MQHYRQWPVPDSSFRKSAQLTGLYHNRSTRRISTVPATTITDVEHKSFQPQYHNPFNIANLPHFHRGARAGESGIYFIIILSLFENATYAPGFGVPSSHNLQISYS
ncbi:hypothetical protein HDV63DRAFT_376413 [Trichoderma sp. SZMC 28014]